MRSGRINEVMYGDAPTDTPRIIGQWDVPGGTRWLSVTEHGVREHGDGPGLLLHVGDAPERPALDGTAAEQKLVALATELQRIMAAMVTNHQRHLLCRMEDRKSTRLNSSHSQISYAVF